MFPSTSLPSEVVLTFNAPVSAYVALSRCTWVPGLTLKHPLEPRHALADAHMETFLKPVAVETAPHQLTV